MSDISEIKQLIEQQGEAFAQFKQANDARLLELEKKGARLAATSGNLQGSEVIDAETGEGLTVLRTPEQYKSFYRARNDKAFNSQKDDGVGIADFLRGIANMKTSESARKALAIGSDPSGGFAVPDLLQAEILSAMVPQSALLASGAGTIPLDGAKTTVIAAINSLPTASWRGESQAIAESEPVFNAINITAKSLSFYFKMSRELLADSPNIEGALTVAIAQAFAKELDRAGLRGAGAANEPMGLLSNTNVPRVTNGGSGAALASYANFFSAMQTILQNDGPMPTAAIMAPRSLVKLGGLTDSTGQPIAIPQMLSRMSMVSTSQVPINLTVGGSTDCSEIYVGDFTKFAFCMRENVSIQVLSERFAEAGQIAFVGHVRADVATLYPKAFAIVTGVRA